MGSSGSVWRASAVRGGPEIAMKVVSAGPAAEREVAALRALAHPHVVRLHDAILLDDDRLALVFDLVDGGTLASVLAQRGHLSPGEVVTLMAPLAQTIADLHADGVQHGDLAPGNVLFDRTGRPVLADLGTARITGEPREEVFGTAGYVDPVVLVGGQVGPASDVYGLGALAWFALAGQPPSSPALRPPLAELVPAAPPALLQVVQAAVDSDPTRRPDPASMAAALQAACDPTPIWLPGAGPDAGGLTHRIRAMAACAPAEPERRRRHRAGGCWWPRRRARRSGARQSGARRPASRVGTPREPGFAAVVAALVAAAAAALLVLVAVAGWPGAGPPRPPQRPALVDRLQPTLPTASRHAERPAATPPSVDARLVVAELAGRRAALFADPPRAVAASVSARGSPAALADETGLQALRERGLAYRGLHLRTHSVRVVEAGSARLVVEVVTAATAYDVVDRDGARVAHVGAQPPRRARLTLVLTGQGWRVQAVQP